MKIVDYIRKINLSNRVLTNLLVFSIILYPLLFIFQGGDLTDVGYLAMIYQNFFDNLAADKIIFAESFLSLFIGATWFKFFPNSGILGLKVLYLLYLYSVVGIIFMILKKVTKNHLLLLIGLFCGLVFHTRYPPMVLAYDSISWLFLILTSFFAFKGLTSRNNLCFFLSGVFLVFASLSRLPDIVFILLILFVLYYVNLYKNRVSLSKYLWLSIKQYSLFISGVISSLIAMFLLFKYLDIYDIFIKNLDLFQSTADSNNESTYSLSSLIKSYISESIIFLPHLLSVVSLMVTTSLVYEYSKIKKSILPIVIFVVLLFSSGFFVYKVFSYSSRIKYLIPAFCSFPLIMSLISKDRFSVLVALFCMVTLTQVAGTNTGLFLKLSTGFMILIPLSLLILSEKKQIVFGNIKIYTNPILIIGISFILFFSLHTRIGWIYHVDSGIACRLKCIYSIDHPKMKGILTTKKNAIYIRQLNNAIERNIGSDKNLFIYGHQPMFYYLTETAPPVKKFWLANNYVQVDELFTSLEKSIKSTGKYPMIADTKQKIMGEKGQKRFEQFLKEYGYKCKERTENFDIWIKKSP